MRISPLNYIEFNRHILSFGNIQNSRKSYTDTFTRTINNQTSKDRNSTIQYFIERLDSIGVKTKICSDNFLEITKFNPNWYSRLVSGDDYLPADLVLQYTKKIKGSVNFGQLGVTNLGALTTLEGSLGLGKKFDFSSSHIKNFGNLRKIDGDMVINKNQLDNFKFEGLKVSGDILLANHEGSKTKYKKLKESDKDALLNGFRLLNYN